MFPCDNHIGIMAELWYIWHLFQLVYFLINVLIYNISFCLSIFTIFTYLDTILQIIIY